MTWIWTLLTLVFLAVSGLFTWRWSDRQADRRVVDELIARAGPPRATFQLAMLEGLPEPAQRFFRFAIEPGTPLFTAVRIGMRGEIGLGSADDPKYRSMRARQVLAPPHGLVWDLRSGGICGSDGASPNRSWTRFWLFGVIPIVRAGGGADHYRSAFGRVVAEGAFWVPASLLPSEFVRWESVDRNAARALVTYGGLEQAVEITVGESGQPKRVVISRWSNENPQRRFREQPFGGELSDFRQFEGYTLPARVVGGNHIGTKDYFPFYQAEVTDIRFSALREEPEDFRTPAAIGA